MAPQNTVGEEIATLHTILQTQAAQISAIAEASGRRDEVIARMAGDVERVMRVVEDLSSRVAPLERAAVQLEGASKLGRFVIATIVFLGILGITLRVGIEPGSTGR